MATVCGFIHFPVSFFIVIMATCASFLAMCWGWRNFKNGGDWGFWCFCASCIVWIHCVWIGLDWIVHENFSLTGPKLVLCALGSSFGGYSLLLSNSQLLCGIVFFLIGVAITFVVICGDDDPIDNLGGSFALLAFAFSLIVGGGYLILDYFLFGPI